LNKRRIVMVKEIEYYGSKSEVELEGYGIVKKNKPKKVSDKIFIALIKQKDIWRIPIKANIRTIKKAKIRTVKKKFKR